MPPTSTPPVPEPVEFSIEEAMRTSWDEESGDYLRLDPPSTLPAEPPSADQA
jgi:hypothetical protein